jgi:hypothetical protein
MFVEDRHEALPTKWASLKSRERHRSRRVTATLIATCLAGFALVVQAPVAGASNHAAKRTPAVGIVPFAGDVFTTDSNNNLIQVDPRFTPASAPLYNLDGNPLGLSWGQWSSATASSLVNTVTKHGIDYTDFRIMLNGLIPSGVYSLFYRTFSPDSANPICPVVDPLIALPARFPQRQTPDPYSFVADSSGGGAFRARVAGRLMDAAAVQVVVIYHFDGNVYGPVPNQGESTPRCFPSFGVDAMRQFLIIQK